MMCTGVFVFVSYLIFVVRYDFVVPKVLLIMQYLKS